MLEQSKTWEGLLIWDGSPIYKEENKYIEAYWISDYGINSSQPSGFLILKTIRKSKVINELEIKCSKSKANDTLKVKLIIDNIEIQENKKVR